MATTSAATLAQRCGDARLEGADWLLTLADDAPLLHALDAFFARACAAQAKRLELPHEELAELHGDARAAFALYARLLRALESATDAKAPPAQATLGAMRATLLPVARLLPFGQLFALRSPHVVRAILDAAVASVESTASELRKLTPVLAKHYERVHQTTSQHKRGQVVELIQVVYESALSIHALASSPAVVGLLFGSSDDATLASDSLLRALTVCYESDLPVLQRALSALDERAQKKAALLVPESRRVLLQILARVLQAAMAREKAASATGESVLVIIHELSHSTEADAADHGSFISDIWHLCGYEATLLEFFDEIQLDRDSVSYLEVILDGLPRRRVLEESSEVAAALKADQPTQLETTKDPATAATRTTTDAMAQAAAETADVAALVLQVQDLFPDLGDGYVALCLLSSQRQLETVINYLLEDNAPPIMAGVRKDLKRSDAEYAALERKALGQEPLAEAPTTEKVDPSRIWVGKRAMEKQYDPQVARKDPRIVEKVMQIVDEYADEENAREAARATANATANANADSGGFALDEYDDDYNDEFEDYEPFSVHDGGQAEGFDAIRRQNRRLRELEAEDAFWEGMRNQNRRAVDATADEEDEDEDEDEDEGDDESKPTASHWARGPARGEWKPPGGAATARANSGPARGRRGADGGGPAAAPMTEQQQQRQRQRDNTNKAKVGNHHRKDRALKKRG